VPLHRFGRVARRLPGREHAVFAGDRSHLVAARPEAVVLAEAVRLARPFIQPATAFRRRRVAGGGGGLRRRSRARHASRAAAVIAHASSGVRAACSAARFLHRFASSSSDRQRAEVW
jgi:hypothetical protein